MTTTKNTVVTKLRMCLWHPSNKHAWLKRPSPQLPANVCWQVGSFFDDGIDDCEVVRVVVHANGVLVSLRYDLIPEYDFKEELDKRLKAGWKLDKGDAYKL